MPNIMKLQKTQKRPAPLTVCPSGSDGLTFATNWYRLPGVEGFFICTKCFEEKISNTQFSGLFESFYNEPLPGTKSICDFNSARVDQILSQAIRSGSTDELFEYAEHRSDILPCDGTGGTHGGRGIRWYNNTEMSGFVACEACYEDFILATPFASRFSLFLEEHPPDEVWICDLAIPYIKRNLIELAKSGHWFHFVNTVNHRSSVPACESKPVILSTRKWFRPTRPCLIPKLMICEACYLDHTGSLNTAFNFTRVHPKVSELQSPVLCSFKIKSIQAYSEQLLKTNYGRWHYLVNRMVSKPPCAKGDITGEWYTLPDPKNPSRNITDFDICGACYLGYIEATGHASDFRKVTYPEGATRVCDFSPTTARFPKFLQKWSQMVYTGDTNPLAEYASRITKITPCSQSKDVSKSRWWGMDEFFFCAECYEEVGRGSYFAPLFNYQGASFPEGRCDMYTDNMRRRYLEACTERTLDEFLNYCRHREEIFQLLDQESKRHKMAVKMNERLNSQHGLMLTYLNHPEHNLSIPDSASAMVVSRPKLERQRRVSAPAVFAHDHRMTEENLKKAQRRAIKESMQKSPALIHLQQRWSEVE